MSFRDRIREDYRDGPIGCDCEKYVVVSFLPYCKRCGHVSANHIDHKDHCIFPLGQNLVIPITS
jgi:hypothetical protein